MYLPRTISTRGLVQFGWKQVLFFCLYSGAIVYLHQERGVTGLSLGGRPLAALSTATAILLGFRNNSAYQRWWEARKIWGGILNESRTFGIRVMSLVAPGDDGPEAKSWRRRMIRGHLAYIWALNLRLRGRKEGWEKVSSYLEEDEQDRLERSNQATSLAQAQGARVAEARSRGWLDGFSHKMLMETLQVHVELQGKAERIAGTPLPRHYAFFTTLFVWIFVLLLPFEMVEQLGVRTIPICALIGWIFISAEQVGRYTEDPFADFKHDVPMDSLCNKAEIDLLEELGGEDVPAPVQPVRGVLM